MSERYVLIIGAGPGLGLAIARRFGETIRKAVLFARSHDNLAALSSALGSEGIDTHTRQVDSSNLFALESSLRELIKAMGPPIVVVCHGAAITPRRPLDLPASEFAHELVVNVVSAHLVTRVVAGEMENGTILYTGGGFAMEPNPDYASLSAGKAALRNLAKSAASGLAERGIHLAIINICGYVEPEGRFAPERIAQAYWDVHCQDRKQWSFELNYV